MSLRARLAVLLAATFAVTGAFTATMLSADPPRGARDGAASYAGAVRPPGIPPADFRLRDQDGRLATLADAKGQVAVVTFLYTTCEDTCPLIGQQIRGGLDRLGHDVPVFAIAVDPPNDTPERAKAFLARSGVAGRLRFLLGPEDALRRQWRAYGIQRQTPKEEHSGYVVLLDGRGVQRVGFPASEVTPEGLAHDLALLEREPPAAGR